MKLPAPKEGAGQLGVPGPKFLGVSQRFVLVLRKLQIRKALGNKRVTGEYYTPEPGMGPRNAACRDGHAQQVR